MSSRLMPALEKMSMQVQKLLIYLELEKSLPSISQPRSMAQQLPQSQKNLLMVVAREELRAMSQMQVMLAEQRAELQLYLQPFGTCRYCENMLEYHPSNLVKFMRAANIGLFQQGSTSGKYIDTPTTLLQAQLAETTFVVKSIEEIIDSLRPPAHSSISRSNLKLTIFM